MILVFNTVCFCVSSPCICSTKLRKELFYNATHSLYRDITKIFRIRVTGEIKGSVVKLHDRIKLHILLLYEPPSSTPRVCQMFLDRGPFSAWIFFIGLPEY